MSYSMKNSTSLIMMRKSFSNSLNTHTDSPKNIKTESFKEDYYIQISPRLETKMLTFTNQIKKLKVIQHDEIEINQSVISQSQPQKEKNNKFVLKPREEQPKSHFYNENQISSRLKAEQ